MPNLMLGQSVQTLWSRISVEGYTTETGAVLDHLKNVEIKQKRGDKRSGAINTRTDALRLLGLPHNLKLDSSGFICTANTRRIQARFWRRILDVNSERICLYCLDENGYFHGSEFGVIGLRGQQMIFNRPFDMSAVRLKANDDLTRPARLEGYEGGHISPGIITSRGTMVFVDHGQLCFSVAGLVMVEPDGTAFTNTVDAFTRLAELVPEALTRLQNPNNVYDKEESV